jgi:hypothetical protein
MRTCRLPFAIVCLSNVLLTSGNVWAEWHNALQPAGAPAGEVLLVRDGKAVCPIQIAVQATVQEKKAAEELQHWIEQISTARPEITSTAVASAVRIEHDPALAEEAYRLAVEGDKLVLAGGAGRGVVNAVYALLEEDLGCRFYTNESIKLPQSKTLVVRPVARTYVPPLRVREPYYKAAFDATWSLRNRTNAPTAPVPEEYGGHVDYDGYFFVHTHAYLLPPEKYFSTHPEYFALNAAGQRYANQLCATDPEVARIVTQTVLDALKNHPHAEIVSISKNDNAGDQICQCERCKKIRADEGGGDIACQLVLVNAVAEAVQKQHPHVMVDTLAYLETLWPPKTIRPRDNVAIRLCNDVVGAWRFPFTPAEQCDVAKAIAAWSGIHEQIYIWDYTVNFSHYLAPMPNIDVMAANIRFWVKNHARGVMLQGGYQGPAERDELKCWVTSKLLWDPSRDEKALVDDFIWGHYGPAAPAIAEYEALLASLRVAHAAAMAAPPSGIRYPMDSPFITKEFLDDATKIFDRAKQLAAGDEAVLRRVERAELPILYAKCVRGPEFVGAEYANVVAEFERIARRENLTHLEEGGANFDAKLAEWKARIPSPNESKN